jgi:hypothetical protein
LTTMVGKNLLLVIPVHFNAEALPAWFAELTLLQQRPLDKRLGLELIFVNGGSGRS